jgi:hypothetical protein
MALIKISQATSAAILALASTITSAPAHAGNSPPKTSWEVSGEFDSKCPAAPAAGNPWTYMSRAATPTASPVAMTTPNNSQPNDNRCTGGSPYPIVFQNSAEKVWNDPNPAGAVHAARGIVLHPGAACEEAIVRFTIPYTGTYAVTGQFYGLDSNGSKTKTRVAIVGVGAYATPTWSGAVDVPSGNIRASFRRSFLIAANKTVDFIVGCPAGGNYLFGSTGLHAVIEYWGPGRQPGALNNPFTSATGATGGTSLPDDPKDPR